MEIKFKGDIQMIRRKDELTKVVGPIEGGKGNITRELLIEGDELKNKAKVFAKLSVPVGGSVGLLYIKWQGRSFRWW